MSSPIVEVGKEYKENASEIESNLNEYNIQSQTQKSQTIRKTKIVFTENPKTFMEVPRYFYYDQE